MIRKICVVTGSRADYGLLRCLLVELRKRRRFRLKLVATGSHFSPRYGNTWREIVGDGFRIDHRVNIGTAGDTAQGVARSAGLALIRLSRVFRALSPDAVLVLGDRYEILAAAEAAMFCRIPIIHLHGGETSEGAIDEAIRHAITKMSHLHFVSNPVYRRRVIQLGEDPAKVFVVGALGLDEIRQFVPLRRKELERKLRVKFSKRNILVTFHPPTLSPGGGQKQMRELLAALGKQKDTTLIFTMPNADMESLGLFRMVQRFVRRKPQAHAFRSLGRLNYLSCLKHVDVVVGNSSSGILEAPSLRCATVNIGNRQEGRIRASSVIDCEPRCGEIARAIQKASSPSFRRKVSSIKNPYDQGGAAFKIIKILAKKNITLSLNKKFYDLKKK